MQKHDCDKCHKNKLCENIGIIGINNYFICKLCLSKMTPEDHEKLTEYLVDNA